MAVALCAAAALAQTPARKSTAPDAGKPAAKSAAARPATGAPAAKSASTRVPATGSRTGAARSAVGAKAGAATKQSRAKAAATQTASAKRRRRAPASRVPRQMAPTPERYKEIQDALASKGYLRPDQASGAWDQNSADALKRFQHEQKIGETGKIDSLSLIALGLGPKHDSGEAKAVSSPVPEPGTVQNR